MSFRINRGCLLGKIILINSTIGNVLHGGDAAVEGVLVGGAEAAGSTGPALTKGTNEIIKHPLEAGAIVAGGALGAGFGATAASAAGVDAAATAGFTEAGAATGTVAMSAVLANKPEEKNQ